MTVGLTSGGRLKMNEIYLLMNLMVAHTIADYCMQDAQMIKDKKTYGWNTAVWHSGTHALFTFIILTFFVSSWAAIFLALGNGLVHYHIDWFKAQIEEKYRQAKDGQQFWMLHGADQLAHFFTLIVIVQIAL